MSTREWIHLHHAQTLLNGEQEIRKAVRNGTYCGVAPIANEGDLDQMIEQAQSDVEAAGLDWEWTDDEVSSESSSGKRGGLLGWLFG